MTSEAAYRRLGRPVVRSMVTGSGATASSATSACTARGAAWTTARSRPPPTPRGMPPAPTTPSKTARWAGALKAVASMPVEAAGSSRAGNCSTTWSSWRSSMTTGSRRSGRGIAPAARRRSARGPPRSARWWRAGRRRRLDPALPARADLGGDRLDLDAEQSGEDPGVLRAKGVVADARRRWARRRAAPGCALGGVEVEPAHVVRTANSNIGTASSTRAAHGVGALGLTQLARVLARLLDGDERLRGPALVLAERAHRRLLTGLVAVEREDHPGGREVGLVAHDPAQRLDVVDAEGRAAGGDGGLDAGEVAGHDVGVPLDDHRGPVTSDGLLGGVEAIEHGRLLVDRRLGGVEVLRLDPVVVEEPARAEPDAVAGDVPDRPDQPAPEPVVETAAPAPGEPAATISSSWTPLPRRWRARSSPPRGAYPTPNRVAAALSKPRARMKSRPAAGGGVAGVEELVGVELLRDPVRLDQPGAAADADVVARPVPPSSWCSSMPSFWASRSTASVKVRCSTFCTNEMTSPPSPQP